MQKFASPPWCLGGVEHNATISIHLVLQMFLFVFIFKPEVRVTSAQRANQAGAILQSTLAFVGDYHV